MIILQILFFLLLGAFFCSLWKVHEYFQRKASEHPKYGVYYN